MASGLSARIPKKLLHDGGPDLAAHLTAHLGRLIADAVSAGRKTRALELAGALSRHADDPALARAAAALGEFPQPYRVVGTGLFGTFTRLAARGMLAEPDRDTRLSALERLAVWSRQPDAADASAEVRALLVAERREEGGRELRHELTALVRTIAMANRADSAGDLKTVMSAAVDEILDLSAERAAERDAPIPDLVRHNRSMLKALRSVRGARYALAASARGLALVESWTDPGDPEGLPLMQEVTDDHISLLLELDRLDDAIVCSRRLLGRYESLGVTDLDPGEAAINYDRHAHFLDQAGRHTEAVEVSRRAITVGETAEPTAFPRFAGLLRFHAERLTAVGRAEEAVDTAVRAVGAARRSGSPTETAFALGAAAMSAYAADRTAEAMAWSRKEIAAWRELVQAGIGFASANLDIALHNHEFFTESA